MSESCQIKYDKNNSNGARVQKASRPKLIFVGKKTSPEMKKARRLASQYRMAFQSYSEEEWATLEEIEQYIQEEELSKQIIHLPSGLMPVSSLGAMEAETIKRAMKKVNGNVQKAARILQISRATLYRKIEKYCLDIKWEKEDQLKKETEKVSKAA